MMINNSFSHILKTFKNSIGLFACMAVVFGCGGGGGGGGGIGPAGDQIPSALISSPTDTIFIEGENITFGGSGSDNQDGPLDGSALTWRSNIDGDIGTGSTLSTSILSAGPHEITLKAVDSDSNEYITAPAIITVEQTRFIKIGPPTAGVTDASYAFDGDNLTAATIMTPDTGFIHFKAHLGGADTFLFKIKMGASTIGSNLTIEGLDTNGDWLTVVDGQIVLDADKTVTIKVTDAQLFIDAGGYINLRARLINGQGTDNVPVYEIWRVDPPYAGLQTTGVDAAEQAFDDVRSTHATISDPWNLLDPKGTQNYLYFKIYGGMVGMVTCDAFKFDILLNEIGPQDFLAIEIETQAQGDWQALETLNLDTAVARTVSVSNVLDFLDNDGYINLRAGWVTVSQTPPIKNLELYEISRTAPFCIGDKTTSGFIQNPPFAVDDDPDSYASIFYFWGESSRYHFLHVQTYVGDASVVTFSIQTAASAPSPEAELIVEGESEPDVWTEIKRFGLDSIDKTIIELLNARDFVDADGYISLRTRWEAESFGSDAYINEIQREPEMN